MNLSDEQKYEARSVRYVDAARTVQLQDGTFVVYAMSEGAEIGATKDPTELASLVTQACERSAAFWVASRQKELVHRAEVAARHQARAARHQTETAGGPAEVQMAASSLEELDL